MDPHSPTGTRDFLLDTDDPDGTQEVRREGDRRLDRPTFGEVRGAIAALLPAGPQDFSIDGVPVRDEDVLGEGRLVRGALLRRTSAALGEVVDDENGGRMPLGSGALVEVHIVGGSGAGRIIPLARGAHLVGRSTSSAVCLEDPGVSRAHAHLRVDDTGVHLRDLDTTNPSILDGCEVIGEAPVHGDSHIRIASTTLMVRRVETAPASVSEYAGGVRLNRRPRFVRARSPETIRFPTPPQRPPGARAPVIAALTPLAVSVLLATAMRSPAMLVFGLLSPVMLLAQWWGDRRNGRQSYRAQLADHVRAVDAAESLLAEALAKEAMDRRTEQPDLAFAGRVASHRDARLWERRPDDPDHLVLRVGTADQAAEADVDRRDEAAPEPLVDDVPVALDLNEAHVVGIAGPRTRVLAVVGALVAQLAVWHSARTTRLVVLSAAADPEGDWAWLTRLPHARGQDGGPTALVASIDDEPALMARMEELGALIASRAVTHPSAPDQGSRRPHHVVVLLDGAQQLRAHPGVAALLAIPAGIGIHVLAIDDVVERLPAEARGQLVVGSGPTPRAMVQLAERTIQDIIPDLPHRSWLESLSRAMAPMEDATPDPTSDELPDALGLRDVHRPDGLDPTNVEDLVSAWGTSDGRPAAVLGVTAEGPLHLDLAKDGPHCLVGGTTGSGKSELLQTLVSGLAVRARPDELSFVLVDYKGGSAFKECSALPHTLGVVTDLDEHLTRRALVSLGAELKRREILLAEAGAKDLDHYRRLRVAHPDRPRLARLVLVVDEFKLLAEELPEFVDGLVRIAAVGRSLGLHLVLATQRPAGIITGDMRANISLRIALRVRDRSDSEDVVESPAASEISDRTPGRGLVRTADGRLVELQAAYSGTAMASSPKGKRRPPRVHELSWADLGRPIPPLRRDGDAGDGTELEALVSATREAARRLGIVAPSSPWLPPLPTAVAVDRLPPTGSPEAAPLGLADQPEHQSRSTHAWHPVTDGHLAIAGGARTGRSTALRTLTVGLAERWDPSVLHLHVLEGTPGSLRDLAALPHVGSVTSSADPLLAARVVTRLVDGLAHAPATGDSPHRPVMVVLVDGWEALQDAFETVDHGSPTEALLRLARDGLAAGVRLVVTGGRPLLSGRLASVMQRRLVLPMPDPLDLTLAGLAPDDIKGHQGPGRAIDATTRHHLQLAHVGPSPLHDEQARAVVRLATEPSVRRPTDPSRLAWRVEPLPATAPFAQLPPAEPHRIWLGPGGDDARPVGLEEDRCGGRALILGPPRSGRTAALALVARQLTSLGRPTALVATRRVPRGWLDDLDELHVVPAGDGDRLRTLRRAHPGLCVLVDDAECLDGTAAEAPVLDAFRDLDQSGAWLMAAVDSRRANSLYRGLVPDLARHGTGLVLWPTAPTDGELLGVRLHGTEPRVPGRGALVVGGVVTPIQLADPRTTVPRDV